jgi:hypothetical protein
LDPVLEHVLRLAIALLLASGGVRKLRDLPRFADAVAGYALLPARAARTAAAGFAIAEVALAAGLLAPAAAGVRPAACASAALLFAVYGAAIAINLARGRRDVECGCGGPAGARVPLSGWLVARNALLVAAALACAGGAAERALGAADAPALAGGVAALALLWIAAHGLLANAASWARFGEAA